MHPLQGFTCSIINLFCFGAHSDIHWCRAFLLQRSQKYHVLWLIQFWKQFHSLLHYLILLNFSMQMLPQGNKFQQFAHWSQDILQDSNLKNTWSSIMEGFPSLLSGLSLNFAREHSAQFMTIYRFNMFLFSFFSPLHLPQLARVHAAEEEVENAGQNLLCSTILCHPLPMWQSPALWRVEITFPRNQHGLYGPKKMNRQTKAFLDCTYFPTSWKKHILTTLFSAPRMWWRRFTHSVQHLQKLHKNTGRNAGVLHITN